MLVVLALIVGLAPLNVSAVELNVLPLYVPAAVTFPTSVKPPLPLLIVVAETPVAEPKKVLWSVALLPRLQVAVPAPQTSVTAALLPPAPIVIVPELPWSICTAVLLLPPRISVWVLAPVLPSVNETLFVEPIVIAPYRPPVAVPESMSIAPEAPLVALPLLMLTAPVAPLVVESPDCRVTVPLAELAAVALPDLRI